MLEPAAALELEARIATHGPGAVMRADSVVRIPRGAAPREIAPVPFFHNAPFSCLPRRAELSSPSVVVAFFGGTRVMIAELAGLFGSRFVPRRGRTGVPRRRPSACEIAMESLETRRPLAADVAGLADDLVVATAVDNSAPVIRSIKAPAAGTYAAGETLAFRVKFNEPVIVTGQPTLPIRIGDSVRQAVWSGRGSGTRSLVFTHTVQPGDSAPTGVKVAGPIEMSPSATIRDAAGHGLVPRAAGKFPKAKVDAVGPQTVAFEAPKVSSRGRVSQRVWFNEPVRVTGTPSITITIDQVEHRLTLARGLSNGRQLTFVSGVGAAGQPSSLAANASATARQIMLEDGTIMDRFGNPAIGLGAPAAQRLAVSTLPGSWNFAGAGNFSPLFAPSGIAVDSAGNLYASDYVGNSIWKLAPGGNQNWSTLPGSFSSQSAVSVNPMYGYVNSIGAQNNGETSQVLRTWPSSATGYQSWLNNADFSQFASGLTTDAAGSVYVADLGGGLPVLSRITPDTVRTDFPLYQSRLNPQWNGTPQPVAVSVDASGNIFVIDVSQNNQSDTPTGLPAADIWKYSSTTSTWSLFLKNEDAPGGSFQPSQGQAMAIDPAGNLFLADAGNSRILTVPTTGSTAGAAVVFAGSGMQGTRDGLATSAQFANPLSVAVDATGTVYVMDGGLASNNYTAAMRRIRKEYEYSNVQLDVNANTSLKGGTLGPVLFLGAGYSTINSIQFTDSNGVVFAMSAADVKTADAFLNANYPPVFYRGTQPSLPQDGALVRFSNFKNKLTFMGPNVSIDVPGIAFPCSLQINGNTVATNIGPPASNASHTGATGHALFRVHK